MMKSQKSQLWIAVASVFLCLSACFALCWQRNNVIDRVCTMIESRWRDAKLNVSSCATNVAPVVVTFTSCDSKLGCNMEDVVKVHDILAAELSNWLVIFAVLLGAFGLGVPLTSYLIQRSELAGERERIIEESHEKMQSCIDKYENEVKKRFSSIQMSQAKVMMNLARIGWVTSLKGMRRRKLAEDELIEPVVRLCYALIYASRSQNTSLTTHFIDTVSKIARVYEKVMASYSKFGDLGKMEEDIRRITLLKDQVCALAVSKSCRAEVVESAMKFLDRFCPNGFKISVEPNENREGDL